MQAGLSTKNAPSPKVVLPHYAYAAFAFIAASILLYFSANDLISTTLSPKILSMVHVLVLGWASMMIFGALYQLIPVVMEIKLYSEKLALASFILLGIGTPLMAISFWTSFIGATIMMMTGGTLVVLSVLLFVINTSLSARKSDIKSIENRFIVTSGFWLLIAVSYGLLMIIHPNILSHNSLQIHIHLGIIGWFMTLIVGVASVLMPMFFISHQLNRKYLTAAYWFINGGLLFLLVSFYLKANTYIIVAAATTIIVGFILFIKYNYDAYKKRLRRKLDIGMKHSVLAFVLLFITLTAAFIAAFGDTFGNVVMHKAMVIYGISLFFGFITSLILGQMYKTLPFIIWLKLYQDKVGKFKTPLPADMHSQKVADLHYQSFVTAFVILLAGLLFSSVLLIKIAAILMLITALLYTYNTIKVLAHKEKLEPLVFPKPKPIPKTKAN